MSTTAKIGAFFLVVLVLAGLLIWKIEDLRFGRGAGQDDLRAVQRRGGAQREVRRAHGGRSASARWRASASSAARRSSTSS